MTPDGDERAKGVDLPSWWLERVRELVEQRDENLSQLGVSLAKAIGKAEPWDHSSVSRFLRNRNTTIPMAEAFAALLGMPRPFFVPRSLDEAIALQAAAKRYDDKHTVTPEQAKRLAVVDQLVDAAREQADDQRRPVESRDGEGAHRSRRSGRATRGRPKAS